MKFLLHKLNISRKKRSYIGFVTPHVSTYNNVLASTRIRVYDIINSFGGDPNYELELFKGYRNYDIVIFQKRFDKVAYKKAKILKKKGVSVILDINVNYYDNTSELIKEYQYQDIIKFTKLCDAIITPSIYIKNYIESLKIKKNVFLIYENINNKYLNYKKSIPKRIKHLIWSGFSEKANEISLIKDVLIKLHKKYNFKLIIISEKKPSLYLNDIQIEFIKYKETKIVQLLKKGDLFIAPRNLEEKYNLGHSFTKIGVAMALGIPVLASAVPSYINSPAIICKSNKDWYENLKLFFEGDFDEIGKISKKGKEYCKTNYSIDTIKLNYETLFLKILKNEN